MELLTRRCCTCRAAAALRNARLFAAERRAHSLRALLEVSHEITSTFDVDRILLSIVNLAERAVRFERCIIAVRERAELRVRAISGENDVDRKSTAVKEIERFLQWQAQTGAALFLNDVQSADAEALALRERFEVYLKDSGARGLLIIPVADAEGELGRLLFEFGAPDVLTVWMREAAELLANQAALALRNAQFYADVPFIFLARAARAEADGARQFLAPGGSLLLQLAGFQWPDFAAELHALGYAEPEFENGGLEDLTPAAATIRFPASH